MKKAKPMALVIGEKKIVLPSIEETQDATKQLRRNIGGRKGMVRRSTVKTPAKKPRNKKKLLSRTQ